MCHGAGQRERLGANGDHVGEEVLEVGGWGGGAFSEGRVFCCFSVGFCCFSVVFLLFFVVVLGAWYLFHPVSCYILLLLSFRLFYALLVTH